MYAKDKIRPKLQQVDEEKIARLYSELRRESLASGGIPITVRHIESVIRMAEAHARMHLRDYVRSVDIDMSIRVVLDSFIGAQKFSVMKSLRKSFAHYITFKKDHFSLLLHILQGLLREAETFYLNRYGERSMPDMLDVDYEEFEARARELDIHDIRPFLKSSLFTENGCSFDETKRQILKQYASLSTQVRI
jgi:DNA replication licensing factor MCM2